MYNYSGDIMDDREKTELLEIDETNKRIKNNKKLVFFRTLPLIFIPALVVLTIISLHSTRLVFVPLNYFVYIMLSLFILLFIIGLFTKNKRSKKKHYLAKTILILYTTGCIIFTSLLYGPYDKFRTWLISTAMATMNHQYLCKWFYSDKEIIIVLNNNYIIEIDENTDPSLINSKESTKYENKYEEQILKRDKNQKYKLITMEVNGQKAYLAAVYDPSKVKVGVTSALGRYGQYATTMAKNNKAILAVNGGGFYDPGNRSTGGMPTGITIAGGKIITNNNYSSYTQSGGIIGFNKDNVLMLMKDTTANKAIQMGVRDAISWGPFLIVNGKKSFIKGNGGWGYAARTAIGQRKDGIVLLLVIDSNATRTKGADMTDLTEIMSNYGAVNAANLDGGTSSVMVLPKNEALKYNDACRDDYCYINDPIDSSLAHKTRGIATTIIVTE